MITNIDHLIRHLKSQIKEADKINSQFVYITKREAEECLELAEAQDVIQEILAEDRTAVIRCKDCKHRPKEPNWEKYESGFDLERIAKMNVRIELMDYEERDKAFENPRIVVRDAGPDYEMVRIIIGDKTVKVSGKEITEAVSRCMRAQWPY